MKILLLITLFFAFSEVIADECRFSWDENPASEEVSKYTLYNGDLVVSTITRPILEPDSPVPTFYNMTCISGVFSVTATNYLSESTRSESITLQGATMPSGFNKIIIINIIVN